MEQTPKALGEAQAAVTPPTAVPVREVPVVKGQVVQAMVTAVEGERVWLGWRGSVFEARSLHLLEAGKSYDFVVSATEPNIALTPLGSKATDAAMPAPAVPGIGGAQWLRPLVAMLQALPDAAPPRADQPAPDAGFTRALRALADGKATAVDLQVLQQGLGHDQEARVLRLAPRGEAMAEVDSLRSTRKATALMLLADAAGADKPPREAVQKALAFVTGMNGAERDNARRADQGLPLWLPLPACPAMGLRDARMFALAGERESGAPADAREAAFTIVLLLDLTRLGELRVDLVLRHERIDVTFLLAQPRATALLASAAEEMRQALQAVGLKVERLAIRQCRAEHLPVADLALPPRDGSAMVDCHA